MFGIGKKIRLIPKTDSDGNKIGYQNSSTICEGQFGQNGTLCGFGRKLTGLDKQEIGWFNQGLLCGYGKKITMDGPENTTQVDEGLYEFG